jgi:hypothetical protein
MLRELAGLVILLFIAAGCSKPKPIRIVDDAEIDAMRSAILGAAEANAHKKCLRAPLRGEASAGPADQEMLSLLDREGTLGSCFAAVDRLDTDLSQKSDSSNGIPELLQKLHDHESSSDGSFSLSPQEQEQFSAIVSSCKALPSMLSKAVSHENACSPYLPGRRPMGAALPEALRIAKGALVLSHTLAEAGEHLQGVQLLLDVVRFGHDLGRGGTSLVEPMLGVSMQSICTQELDGQLESLTPEELVTVETQLSALVATQPHPSVYQQALPAEFSLYYILPAFEPDDWTPPGGYPEGWERSNVMTGEPGSVERQGLVLTWIALTRSATELAELCPTGSPMKACIENSAQHSKRISESASELSVAGLVKQLAKTKSKARHAIREQIIGILAALSLPSYQKYYRRIAESKVGLVSLRHKVHTLAALASGEPCPISGSFEEPGLAPKIETEGSVQTLTQPSWLRASSSQPDRVLARITCAPPRLNQQEPTLP